MLDEHPQYSVLSLENVECCWGGGGGGGLGINVDHHGWSMTKNKKKIHWLKRLRAVPKTKFGPKYK